MREIIKSSPPICPYLCVCLSCFEPAAWHIFVTKTKKMAENCVYRHRLPFLFCQFICLPLGSKRTAWLRVTVVNQHYKTKWAEHSDSLLWPDPNQWQTLYFCHRVGWPLWSPLNYCMWAQPYFFCFLFQVCVFQQWWAAMGNQRHRVPWQCIQGPVEYFH